MEETNNLKIFIDFDTSKYEYNSNSFKIIDIKKSLIINNKKYLKVVHKRNTLNRNKLF